MIEEVIASPLTQLGALGLLAVFVVLSLRRDNDRDKATMKVQQQFLDQQASDTVYMRTLVSESIKSQKEQILAWGTMTQDTIAAHAKVADSYVAMTKALAANWDAIAANGKETRKTHAEIQNSIQNSQAAIDDLRRALQISQDYQSSNRD